MSPRRLSCTLRWGACFGAEAKVERAIRMHQNLLDRPDLLGDARLQALYELAQDYLKAGLLDRAEEFFAKLEGTEYEQQGLRFLLEIYEQEKDWAKAIDASRRMDEVTGKSSERDIAHYFCELAVNELTASGADAARRHLEEALSVNRKCVRANLLLGDLAMSNGDARAAIAHWKRIEQQDPAYLALVAEKIVGAYRSLGETEEGVRLIREYLSRYPSLDLLNVSFEGELELQGAQSANRLVREELMRNPTLLGLDKLLEAQLMEAPPERRNDLQLIKNLIHQHTRSLALYRCDACGFKARQFYWQCPACNAWETYPPRRSEEQEIAG